MLKDQISRFAKERIAPLTPEMDKKSEMDKGLVKELFEQGLMGIDIPAEYNGSGLSFVSSLIAIEELAVVDPAVSVMVDVQNTLVIPIIKDFGSKEQKEQWLPRLAQDTVGSFCLSEAGSGSDAFALRTTAKDNGDHWLLNGSKMWITNGKEAGVYVVFATINPALGYKGITAFLVPRETPGFRVVRTEDKLGIRASSTAELLFENVRLPKNAVVGEVGKGYKVAIGQLNAGRVAIGAQMLGVARGAFETAVEYIHQRKQFGKAISEFQGMQFQVAQAATDIYAARCMVHDSARMLMNGMDGAQEAAMAKYFSSQVAANVARKAVEWCGGNGFVASNPVTRFYRDSIIGSIYEGTSNILLETIAKRISKEYKA